MLMLSIACALDWNYNVNRRGKVDKDGKPLYKSKVIFVCEQQHIKLKL